MPFITPQFFIKNMRVILNYTVRSFQNTAGRAVIKDVM
ncbi:hypothetical protein J973_4465, partial [Acinetobacter baumannii 26016_7]